MEVKGKIVTSQSFSRSGIQPIRRDRKGSDIFVSHSPPDD